MELQRREDIHLKHFLQHTTNLQALVEWKYVLATAILLVYLVKHMITMEAIRISQISSLLIMKFWVFIQFSKWLSHHIYIKCR